MCMCGATLLIVLARISDVALEMTSSSELYCAHMAVSLLVCTDSDWLDCYPVCGFLQLQYMCVTLCCIA